MSRQNGAQAFLSELGSAEVSDEFRQIWNRLSTGARGDIIMTAASYCSAKIRSGKEAAEEVVLFPYAAESKVAGYALLLTELSEYPVFSVTDSNPERYIRFRSDLLAIRSLRRFLRKKIDAGSS